MSNAATAYDFATWTEKAERMTSAQLLWAIADCAEAAKACDAHDPGRAGRYMDELSCYRTALGRR